MSVTFSTMPTKKHGSIPKQTAKASVNLCLWRLCDERIRNRLVIGIKNLEVRKRLLREKALTLNTALDIIRAAETASDQLKKIDGEIETSVHAVKYRGK